MRRKYSAYWRTTIFVSIILHFIAWFGLSFALPYLMPKPKIDETMEMNWVDVDLAEEEHIEVEPIDTSKATEIKLPEYEFPPIIIPDVPNEPIYIEPIKDEPIPIPADPPIQIQKPPEAKIIKDENEVTKQSEKKLPKSEVSVITNQENQQMGQPPVIVNEFYPQKGSGLNYKGYVSIAATIGKDGKVYNTKVILSSGRLMVDNIAINAAKKWTFKPALDKDGRPMACEKIITFDFKQFA